MQHYDLIITTPEGEFQPTHKEIIEAIHAVIDKKFREASSDLIPREGITKVEVISLSKRT